jgi:hypothetical protein
MGKYENLEKDVFSIFGSTSWKNENIKTFPVNFIELTPGTEFVRVSVIPSGNGINLTSISGVLIIDIFTSAGNGPRKTSLIADKLDSYLVGKSVSTVSGNSTQFNKSALAYLGLDTVNSALYRATYSIPFNYFGV